jgi:hypothetical protein
VLFRLGLASRPAQTRRYWIVDQKVVDLSAYGKFVDTFEQDFGSVTVSSAFQIITVQRRRRKQIRRRHRRVRLGQPEQYGANLSQLRRQVSRGIAIPRGDGGT